MSSLTPVVDIPECELFCAVFDEYFRVTEHKHNDTEGQWGPWSTAEEQEEKEGSEVQDNMEIHPHYEEFEKQHSSDKKGFCCGGG